MLTAEQKQRLKSALRNNAERGQRLKTAIAKAAQRRIKVQVTTWGEYKKEMKGTPDNYKMLVTEHLTETEFRASALSAQELADRARELADRLRRK